MFQPKVAIYPGTFNPFHYGHLSALREAERTFDQVVLAKGINPTKQGHTSLITTEDQLLFHQVVHFDSLLSTYLHAEFPNASIVRGIRNDIDLIDELKWRRHMQRMAPTHPVVWIGTDAEYAHIDSSAIRGINFFSPKDAQELYPKAAQIYKLKEGSFVGI